MFILITQLESGPIGPLFYDTYYMKAIDSRNQSDNQRAELVNQQLKRVNADIQKAIKKGLYEVMVYESLYDEVHDQLQANGYQTFRRGGRMGDRNTLIKWNAAK